MKIGFTPCGFTSREIIKKLTALGGINNAEYDLGDFPTSLYWYIDSTSGAIVCNTGNVLDVRLNPNDHKELINSLNDLPSEIKELIQQRQIDAGNKADLSVFTKFKSAGKCSGGFDWENTEEGYYFWQNLFTNKQYYKFYTLHKEKTHETELQGEEASIGRSKNITGSGIRCERCKPTIAGGHIRDRKAIVF